MKKQILMLPAMLMGLMSCNKGLQPVTYQFDYIFTAEPVVSATNSSVFKNVQNDFKVKASNKRIVQASVFVNKNTDANKVALFLKSLKTDIQNGVADASKIKDGIEAAGSTQAQQSKYGVPGAMAFKVTTGDKNGFSLGFEYASAIKEEIYSFAKLLNPALRELTDDHIFSHTIDDDTQSFSDLRIIAPTGAPAVAFYNYATNANFSTTGNPATALIPMFGNDNYDIIVAPTHGGLMQVINNNKNYQIAASITFGNMYIVSMGTDADETLNEGDKVLYFQKNDLPGKVFNYLYGDMNLFTYDVAAASDTKNVIENHGILRV